MPSGPSNNIHLKSFYMTAAWTYVMYLTVQICLNWKSDHTVTDVKIVKFNESNGPCLVFVFFDLLNKGFLNKCPSDWKISDRGEIIWCRNITPLLFTGSARIDSYQSQEIIDLYPLKTEFRYRRFLNSRMGGQRK